MARIVCSAGVLLLALLTGCSEPAGTVNSAGPDGQPVSAAELASDVATKPDGEHLFGLRCAGCHGNPEISRAAPPAVLALLNSSQVAFAMTNGVMKEQSEGLQMDQVIAIATFITGGGAPYEPAAELFCARRAIDPEPLVGRWAVDAASSGSLPAGASDIDSSTVHKLTLAWSFGLPNVAIARSQPVITRDTLFVAATSGHLFALDRVSGCIRWHQALQAPPRTSLTLGVSSGRPVLLFGDGEAFVNAVSLENGALLWRTEVKVSEHSMLTGATIQHEGRLIVPVSMYEVALAANPDYECCKSHGGVVALDADSGQQLWATPTTPPATRQALTKAGVQSWGPSGAPVWSTPTVDPQRGLVYVGTGQNASLPATAQSDAVLALELETGKLVWHFQTIAGDAYNVACDLSPPGPNCPKWRGPDHDIGAAVVLVRDAGGKDRLIVGQKSGDLYALDPDDAGRMIWQRRVGAGSALGGVHWGLAVTDGVIYAPVADPPFPFPNYRPRPGLFGVSVQDGKVLWESMVERDCKTNMYEYFGRDELYPECSFYFGLSAAPLAVNDLVFAPALDGRIRAFDRADGRVVWTESTARPYESVNGVPTHGGAIDSAGVQAAGDMLYVQSGYGLFGQLPGNALLAFRLAAGREQTGSP